IIPPAVVPVAPYPRPIGQSPRSAVKILSVGKLFDRKGHEQLLEAVGAIRSRGANCTLTIAGANGPLRQRLIDTAKRLDAKDWFNLEVDVATERLRSLYMEADVFALLTRSGLREFEGFGIVFVEAGLAGVPIVAGRSGGSIEAV